MLLVGVQFGRAPLRWRLEDSLAELAELARSAGARVVGSVAQKLARPSNQYVGSGKLEQIKDLIGNGGVDAVICDDELKPTQQRNLEEALGNIKVIDRTALILDVFARRAQSREGRLQVELAQHEYLLPRLAGQWSHLERIAGGMAGGPTGGIGTRGPGETQIETDRRLVRSRIQRIKRDLDNVRRHRSQYRARRKDRNIPVATLVGYTNAGKSTLLNSLTRASVRTENRLFSTLDPVTRRIFLGSRREVLLTDTVGFIQKLPPSVVAAFRATLEEVEESTFIIHVVDVSHPNASEQADVVDEVLKGLGLSEKPRILVLNKADLLGATDGRLMDEPAPGTATMESTVVVASALTGFGLDKLREEMDDLLSEIGDSAALAAGAAYA